ncbi:MAG: DNA internalization-related competence protein ComEC/Rec2 [Acidobacteriota bacterium]
MGVEPGRRTALVLALAAGAGAANFLATSIFPMAASAALAALCASKPRLRTASTALFAAVLGLWIGGLGLREPEPDGLEILVREAGGEAFVWVRGSVVHAQPWVDGSRCLLRVSTFGGAGGDHPCRSRVLAYLPIPPPVEGSAFEASLRLEAPRPPTNPGQPDRAARLEREGTDLVATCRSPGLFRASPPPFLGLVSRYRRALESRFLRAEGGDAAILLAVLLGERGLLSEDQVEVLSRSGLYHLVALSGQHVGLLLLLFSFLAHATGVSPSVRDGAGLILLGLFGLLAASSASLTRALLMAGLFLTARLLARPQGAFGAWSFALAALLVLHPAWLLDAGFQLTFAATFGILILWDALPESLSGPGLRQQVLRLLWVGLCAQLATLPILALTFHRISLLGWLATPLASVPLLGLLAFGIPYMAGLAFVPLAGDGLLWILAGLGRVFLWLPSALGSVRSASLFLPPPSGTWVALFAGAFVLLARKGRWRRAGWILLVFSAVGALVHPQLHPKDLPPSMAVLDVGQASCQVLLDGEDALLIDAGTSSSRGPTSARSVIEPFLAASGLRRVRGMLLTHWDADHAGAAPELLLDLPVGFLGYPATDPPRENLPRRIADRAQSAGVPLVPLASPDELGIGRWRIRVANPGRTSAEEKEENDRSLVLIVQGPLRSILFTGDIGRRTEARLLRTGALPRAEVLVAPHHGASSANSPEWVEALRPRAAVFSVGRSNRFGHPADSVLQAYGRAGSRILRTDRDGAILLTAPQGRTLFHRHRDGDWLTHLTRAGQGAGPEPP